MITNNKNKQSFIEAKTDELHFIAQILRNLKYLERMYKNSIIKNDKNLIGVQNDITNWTHRGLKVNEFFNESAPDKELEAWGIFDQS